MSIAAISKAVVAGIGAFVSSVSTITAESASSGSPATWQAYSTALILAVGTGIATWATTNNPQGTKEKETPVPPRQYTPPPPRPTTTYPSYDRSPPGYYPPPAPQRFAAPPARFAAPPPRGLGGYR